MTNAPDNLVLSSIADALYATGGFTPEQCDELAEGILIYIKDNNLTIANTVATSGNDVTGSKQLIDQSVDNFAGLMKQKLCQNIHKGCWTDECNIVYLANRLHDELAELDIALNQLCDITQDQKTANAIIEECVDVANFAMMIANCVEEKTKEIDVDKI